MPVILIIILPLSSDDGGDGDRGGGVVVGSVYDQGCGGYEHGGGKPIMVMIMVVVRSMCG